VLLLVSALLVLLPAPAFAAPTDEPPDVTGKSVAEAQLFLREQWYPKIEFVMTPASGKPPAGFDETLAVVQKQALRNKGWSVAVGAIQTPVVEFQIVPVVPALTDLPRSAAEKLAAAHGFGLRPQQAGSGPDWVVVLQEPRAGFVAAQFGGVMVVQLRPASAARQVRVPDIRGMTVGQATTSVTVRSLQLGVEMTAPGEAGPIVDQRPAAGTLVAVGTTVVARVRPLAVAPTIGPSQVAAEPPGETPDWVPVVLVSSGSAALLLLLLLLGLLLRRWRRPSRRDPAVAAPVVTARPRAGHLYGPTFEPVSPAPDHVVAVRPRVSPPVSVFEEVP
jgi:hypothetical protein